MKSCCGGLGFEKRAGSALSHMTQQQQQQQHQQWQQEERMECELHGASAATPPSSPLLHHTTSPPPASITPFPDTFWILSTLPPAACTYCSIGRVTRLLSRHHRHRHHHHHHHHHQHQHHHHHHHLCTTKTSPSVPHHFFSIAIISGFKWSS